MKQHFEKVAIFVKKYMESTERPEMGRRQTASFRWRHTLRVLATAREIGQAQGADLEIVEMAALLHDVAKLDQRSEEIHHAVLGSKLASQYLHKLNIPANKVEKITEAVRYHSYDTHQENLCLETLVLKDADRLDEVGALGVVMTGVYAGRMGMDYRGCFRQGLKDMNNLEDLDFYTAKGKEIFARRFQIMRQFWLQAEDELQGEKLPEYFNL